MTTRTQLFEQLGIIRDGPRLDKITEKAYEDYEWYLHREGEQRSITSFWGGAFPAGPELHCGRKAIYELMNIPSVAPHLNAKGRAIVEMGSAAERQIVYRWGRAGLTIGGSVQLEEQWYAQQLRLQDPEIWLSASLDAVLDLRPQWSSVLPVDIKSKSDKAIDEMQLGQRSYDPQHWAQVLCYIGLCREFHKEMGWDDLGLTQSEGGMIYYVSRDNPRKTFEFYVPWDELATQRAKALLLEWKEDFLSSRLPGREKSWRWTEEPCKWCKIKPICKLDVKEKITSLADSNMLKLTSNAEQDLYSPEENKSRVLARWGEENSSS